MHNEHVPSGRRAALVALVLSLVAALAPAAARANVIELGQLSNDNTVTPSCPSDPCRAVTRTTAYQRKIEGEADVFTVTKEARIVAWSIALGTPNKKQEAFFNDQFGGAPEAGISILSQSTKKPTKGQSTLISSSGTVDLSEYYGQTVQIPLFKTLRVHKGERVALTVPTWAPALAVNQPTSTVWRASRLADACTDFSAQTALTKAGATTDWDCTYRTERLTYGVTMVTVPVASDGTSKGTGKNKTNTTDTTAPSGR
jgi:hypothetical protein